MVSEVEPQLKHNMQEQPPKDRMVRKREPVTRGPATAQELLGRKPKPLKAPDLSVPGVTSVPEPHSALEGRDHMHERP